MREKAKKRINREKQKKGMLLLYGKPETFT